MINYDRLRDQPIFICGHPKSGTTLLMALLDSHPQLIVYPAETVFFRGLLPRLRGLDSSEKLSLAKRFLLHFFDNSSPLIKDKAIQEIPVELTKYIQYAQSCQLMDNLLSMDKLRHDGDLLSAAVLAFGEVAQKITPETRYWVEKTPYNEYFAEQIYDWWHSARCIHVVRDPRDNYTTYRRKHPNLTPERFTRSWITSLKAGLQNQKRFGSERYLIIKYEELTQNPEQVITQMVRFLEIEDNPSLRQPTKNGVLWQGNSMFNERFSGISARPLGRWKSDLDPADVSLIETACRKWMKLFDYPVQSGFSIPSYWRLVKMYGLMTWRLPSD
ncbi:MAG: sulfotransferase family protein, partial [Anaerolineales bacterium]